MKGDGEIGAALWGKCFQLKKEGSWVRDVICGAVLLGQSVVEG